MERRLNLFNMEIVTFNVKSPSFMISRIKDCFPLLKHYPELTFVDNASTTQKPQEVLDSITEYYTTSNANIHRAVYDLGVKSDEIYEKTKVALKQHFGKEHCIFTSGTTDGFNKLARGLEKTIQPGTNIIVSEMEHHSNLVPWQELCNRSKSELRVVKLDERGDLDLDHFTDLLDEDTAIVSLVHISNTLGTINDLSAISEKLQDHDCLFLVDAAQSCALHPESIRSLGADAIVFGAHKMFGPSGIGVILASEMLIKKLEPAHYGGGMVTEVEKLSSEFKRDVSRYEAGTPPLAQVAGLGAALDFLEHLDLGQCRLHCANLASLLRNELEKEGIQVLGNPRKHTSIISVTFEEIHPHDVASFLNAKNIAVRAGHHCTQLIMKKYQTHASVRFSFSIYNDETEILKITDAIREMKTYFS